MNNFPSVHTIGQIPEDVTVFGDPNHFEAVAQFFRDDFLGPKRLCDVRLCFGTEVVLAHSPVLGAFSSFFARKMEKEKEKNRNEKVLTVNLSFLKKESVEHLLHFVYHGNVLLPFNCLQDDLEAIAYFGVGRMQEEVEKKLIETARDGKIVDVLNLVTFYLKTIPHSPSTIISITDETIRDLVLVLHETLVANRLSYEDTLRMTTNTVVTIVSSRVDDVKKVDVINMVLKWIYERRVNNQKAAMILGALTFGSMTYTQLVQFRNSLIQTAIPVTVGRCVRLKRGPMDKIDIGFIAAETSSCGSSTMTAACPIVMSSDRTAPNITSSSAGSRRSSHTGSECATPNLSVTCEFNYDDCATAISFDSDDLKRLGFKKKMPKK